MWIIVDGPTCSGKTTLTQQLLEHLAKFGELELIHKSQPTEFTRRFVLKDYVMEYEDYLPGTSPNILADRWHWGEPTYAPIYRPNTDHGGFGLLGVAGWRWVELFLLSRGALTIQLDASDETLVERLNSRGDDHVLDEETLLAVAERYRLTGPMSPTCQFNFNTTRIESNPINLDEVYFAALQAEALPAEILGQTPEYVGNPRPDVLLVGNKRNVTKQYGNETHLPFMPVTQSSGSFLLECLPEDLWPQIGIVNGNDMSGDLRVLWEILGRPRPVALGQGAKMALTKASFEPVEFTELRHPAYTRRFEFSTLKEYGDSIAEAALLKGTYA